MSIGAAPVAAGHADEAALAALCRDGFVQFPPDAETTRWVEALRPHARHLARDAALNARWLRCGGSWFAGVNMLGNGADGAIPAAGVPPLAGRAMAFVRGALGLEGIALDTGQLSVAWPGYPAAPAEGESEAAFRFRRDRDAAHVDGLERDAARRRRLSETHAFILGLPLEDGVPPGAAPLVVWRGSHRLIRAALAERLAGLDPTAWSGEDVTEAYQSARRAVFERCERVALSAPPGGAYLVHRLAVHGVARWPAEVPAAPHGRPVVYFRPEPWPAPLPARDYRWWLEAP